MMWSKTSKFLVSGLALMASFGNVVSGNTILDVAKDDADLSTFVAALEIAEIERVLDCKSWFCYSLTAFAPNNSAFEALPSGLLGNLTQNPDYKNHLRDILLYHVAWGKQEASDITNGTLRTFLHEDVNTTVADGNIFINDAQVVKGDVTADNGVLHVLNQVLIPEFMTKNIIQTIEDLGHFDTLLTALNTASLTSALEGPGPFTLFAPTDSAFDKLGNSTINGLLQDVPALTDILTYHVIPGRIFTASTLRDANLTTLQGEEITVSLKGWWWFRFPVINGDVYFRGFDILASNGVIHVIEDVLTPPSMEPAGPTITDIATDTDSLSTLTAALAATGLNSTLANATFGPVTVFAPNNDAFDELGQETINSLLSNTEVLTNVLLYHVVDGELERRDLTDGNVKALNGEEIEVDRGLFGFWVRLNGDTRIRSFDNLASNGVVHIINKVLVPPSDIVLTATLTGFPTLVKALTDTNQASALQGTGPFTVFAPTEEAFDDLGRDALASLDPAVLTQILLYHVVGGEEVLADDLRSGDTYKTLEGSEITVNRECRVIVFCRFVLNDDVEFVSTDLKATNGVIHAIDKVLIPPGITL